MPSWFLSLILVELGGPMCNALVLLSLLSQTGGLSVIPSAPGDSTPFVVKIETAGLEPNTAYDCGV